ncbi:alpha/beta hydrolase, partial [bacterium]|nr:alpha/beta hydrolase [bacterium]
MVTTNDVNGVERTWHVLDTGLITGPDNSDSPVRGTVLCVHGNPNWSYMWRGLAKRLTGWRVIAVDALNMGFSERTGQPRRLADHVADLGSVTNALQVKGPVITVAHDWGGPISMGWAQQHVDQMAGVVLMNTGVARPAAAKVPALISIARATLRVTCELTPTFLHGALRMARPQMSRDVYRGYASPYDSAARRTGIRDFVEDIPIEDTHPSFDTLASIADGLTELQHLPALLLWGSKDIVFSDMFLHDLMARLPQADVHRYPDAGHQIMEDTDAVDVIDTWLTQHHDEAAAPP